MRRISDASGTTNLKERQKFVGSTGTNREKNIGAPGEES